MECIRHKLWERVDSQAVIGLTLGGDGPLAAATVANEDGLRGVMLLVGEHAIDDARLAVANRVPIDRIRSELFIVQAEPTGEIPEEFRGPVDDAGIDGLTAPLIVRRVPNKGFRRPRKTDFEFIIRALNALMLAEKSGRLTDLGSSSHPRVTVLELSGSLARPQVSLSFRTVPLEAEPQTAPLSGSAPLPPPDLADLPRLRSSYVFGVLQDNVPFPSAVVLDVTADKMLGMEPAGDLPIDDAVTLLWNVLGGGGPVGVRGLPRELTIGHPALLEAVAPILEPLGVTCRYAAKIPHLEIIGQMFELAMHSDDPEAALGAAAARGEWDRPPVETDSDDRQWWKAMDSAVTEELIDLGWDACLANDKAWRRYLGPDAARRDALEAQFGQGLETSFHDWYCHVHRGGRRSRTIAERILAANDIGDDLRTAARARAEAPAGIYRIDRVEPGEGCDLEEVRTGEKVWIDDRSMSFSGRPGLILPMRHYRLGPIRAGVVMGPVLDGLTVTPILEALYKLGLPQEGPIGPEHWHLFGKIWAPIADRASAGGPTLQNTSGETLRMQRGRYRVGDLPALTAALAARPGVEETERGERWHWEENDTIQAHLHLIAGHELEFEVNSDGRLDRLRAWLDRIAGLEWLGAETIPLPWESQPAGGGGPRSALRPVDDRLPRTGPIDPSEAEPAIPAAEIQALLDEKYFAWLDEPIPALGGRSPRQVAAQGAEGRRKITQMIRTYPEPGGIPGIRVPREAMLRELGLDA